MRRGLPLALAVLVAGATGVAGCKGAPAPTAPAASRRPPAIAGTPAPGKPAPAAAVTITGAVRLLGNHGAGVISNNGGAIISDNGAGYRASYRTGYRVSQLAKLAEAALADAVVAVVDAQGKAVAGADGKPLTGRTDRQGRYTLAGDLPAGNLVLQVKLWTGGTLQALLVRPSGAVDGDIDTASSLGTAYVLQRLVKGDQALLDKVPAAEAANLTAAMAASRGLLDAPPDYAPDKLADTAATLRRQAPGVDAAIEAIEALLLGQAKLGDGRRADEVPLSRPYAVAFDPAGRLLIGEASLGRVRRLEADGTIATLVDDVRGAIRRSYPSVRDLVCLPDGTMYLAVRAAGEVVKLAPDGAATTVFARIPGFVPQAIAVDAAGALHVAGGFEVDDVTQRKPGWYVVAPGGATAAERLVPNSALGTVTGLAPLPDGGMALAVSRVEGTAIAGAVEVVPAAGAPTTHRGVPVDLEGALARTPDGTLWVSSCYQGKLTAIAPDGAQTTVPTPGIDYPGDLAVAPDGTLRLVDLAASRVYARTAAGAWAPVAGLAGDGTLEGGRVLALNTPIGVLWEPSGALLIVENGRHRIMRYQGGAQGGALSRHSGSVLGIMSATDAPGDGGPALDARYAGISGIAEALGTTWVLDGVNKRLRKIDAAGIITTAAGSTQPVSARLAGPVAAPQVNLVQAGGVATDAAGRPVWVNVGGEQIQTLTADGQVAPLVGATAPDAGPRSASAALGDDMTDGQPALGAVLRFPLGIAYDRAGDLYVADALHMAVRKVAGGTIATFAGRAQATMATLALGADGLALTGGRRDVDLVIPAGLAFDAAGNMYVSELGTRRMASLRTIVGLDVGAIDVPVPPVPARVRRIAPDGTVTIVAGPGGKFFTDPDAEDALVLPSSLAIGPDGRLAIADPGANLVRILPAGSF